MKNPLQVLQAAAARACHRVLGVFTRGARRAAEDRIAALGVLAIDFARRSVF
jgi:hypothetical protein